MLPSRQRLMRSSIFTRISATFIAFLPPRRFFRQCTQASYNFNTRRWFDKPTILSAGRRQVANIIVRFTRRGSERAPQEGE